MHNSDRSMGIFVALAVAAVIGLIALCVIDYAKTEHVIFTIDNKESVATDSGHEYRVYTDHGTYVVKDSWVHPRFNAADVYGRLDEGQTYDCEVYGWRAGFFSMFKNILNCEEVR